METITVKTKKPSFIGFAAFMIVLFTMPLGHAAMIIMEKTLGESYLTPAAFLLGLVGAALAVWGFYMRNENAATFSGLIGGLMDRLDRIHLCLLRPPLRCSSAYRKRRNRHQARIPHHDVVDRVLSHHHDVLHFQRTHPLRIFLLGTESTAHQPS